MDLYQAIRDLYEELERLDRVIESLEQLQNRELLEMGRRRGRKSMSVEERQMVSERMKKYWAGQHTQR